MNRNQFIVLALLASIAINLVFVGGIAFRYLNSERSGMGRPLPPNIGWIVRDLSEDRRSELAPILQQSFEEIRPIRGELFVVQRSVNQLMAAQPFDAVALELAFTQLREINTRYQELSHRQTNDILNQLSEEERRIALEFVERRGPRDGRDGFKGSDGSSRFGGPGGPGGPGRLPPPPPEDAN